MTDPMPEAWSNLAREMRSLGYSVKPPSDPTDCSCWEVSAPADAATTLLAADEAEAWEKASHHWHTKAVAAAFANLHTPPAPQEAQGLAAECLRWADEGSNGPQSEKALRQAAALITAQAAEIARLKEK